MRRSICKVVVAFALLLIGMQALWAQSPQAPANIMPPASGSSTAHRAPSNLMMWAYIGPGAYLADASVEVIDAKGKVVATGRTGLKGVLPLTVPGNASEAEPYLIVTSGGKVDGAPFRDHLKAYVRGLSFGQITYVDLISTAAQKMSTANPRSYAASLDKVRDVLGLRYYRAADTLRVQNAAVGQTELQAKIVRFGGVARFTDVLAKAARMRQNIGGLKPSTSSRLGASGSLSTTASTSTMVSPCNVEFVSAEPSGSFVSWSTVTDFGILTGVDLINGWTGGAASSAVDGVAGFALSAANIGGDQTSEQILQNLAAIDTELNCISSQIANLQATVNAIALEVKLQSLVPCISGIATQYSIYAALVADAATYPLNASNDNLAALFDPTTGTLPPVLAACSSTINATLFSSSGGLVPAWQTELANMQTKSVNGNAVSMPNVFFPSDVYSLQVFLSYYASMEYQQSVLQSEEYNYQATFMNKNLTQTAQVTMYGGSNSTCTASSAPANPPNIAGDATNFCQWQLNIASVWPQTIFSDELALCTQCGVRPNPIPTGYAIVAVPAGLANLNSAAPSVPTPGSFGNISPNSLAASCIAAGGGTNCSYALPAAEGPAALSNFNNYPVSAPSTVNTETYWMRLAARAAVATSDQLTALSGNQNALNYAAPILSSWLNYSNGAPNTTAPTWTLLTAQSGLGATFKQKSQTNCSGGSAENPVQHCTTVKYNTDTAAITAGLYNPGYNFTPCNNTASKSCNAGSFPATPAAAYLMQRGWTSGTGYAGPTQ